MIRHNILLYSLLLAVILIATPKLSAQSSTTAEQTTFFPYPQVPDELVTLQDRTDYLMTHFWERCDMRNAFSFKPQLAGAISDWLSFTQFASPEVTEKSINAFLENIKKQPDNLLFVVRQAESYLYSDTAQYRNETVYQQFLNALLTNKKVSSADKARYEHQNNLINRSGIGTTPPDMKYTTQSGETRSLAADTAEVLIVMFVDPDCIDCRIARARLDAHPRTTELIEAGIIKVVALYPDKPNEEWTQYAAKPPKNWIMGTAPDADEYFDMRTSPEFYVYDENHMLILKHINIDILLDILNRL